MDPKGYKAIKEQVEYYFQDAFYYRPDDAWLRRKADSDGCMAYCDSFLKQ